MPVDPAMTGPMLDPFRNMLRECEGKGMDNEHVAKMTAAMARIDELAQQCADIVSFNAKITTENLFMEFSNAYSLALQSSAKAKALASAAGDDDAMMANMLEALEQNVAQLRQDEGTHGFIPAVEQAIALGRSGISFPVFLRRLEEEGLSDAMKGSAMTREGIIKQVHFACDAHDPIALEICIKYLEAFDALAAKSRFAAPDNLLFSLAADRIDWEYAPKKAQYKAIEERWNTMLGDVVDWLDAFCSFAPYDERWRTPGASEAQVRENIKRDQLCRPGYFKVREQIFGEYFSLRFDEIFSHPTFANEYAANRIEYSDARLELLRATYPEMTPGNKPSAQLISHSESLHQSRGHVNPNLGQKKTLPVPAGIA